MKNQSLHPSHPDLNHKLSLPELEDAVYNQNRFSHLQLFLNRKEKGDIGQLYLMVSRKAFGIVRVVDLQYENETILLDLKNMEADEEVKRFYLDIHDTRFRFVLLNLRDIKSLIHSQVCSDVTIDDLLELETD